MRYATSAKCGAAVYLALEELRAWQNLQHVRQEVEHELAGLVAGCQQHVGRTLPAEVICMGTEMLSRQVKDLKACCTKWRPLDVGM